MANELIKLLLSLMFGEKGKKQEQHRLPVLIVDDDLEYCEIIEAALMRLGFSKEEIEMAHTLEDAKDKLSRRHYLAYILDQNFPGKKTGLEFDREMRTVHPNVRSVILAGEINFPHPSGVPRSAPEGIALVMIRKPMGGGLSESLGDALRMNGHTNTEPKPIQIAVSVWILCSLTAVFTHGFTQGWIISLITKLIK